MKCFLSVAFYSLLLFEHYLKSKDRIPVKFYSLLFNLLISIGRIFHIKIFRTFWEISKKWTFWLNHSDGVNRVKLKHSGRPVFFCCDFQNKNYTYMYICSKNNNNPSIESLIEKHDSYLSNHACYPAPQNGVIYRPI